MVDASVPKPQPGSEAAPLPPEDPNAVLVRGKYWKNTREDRWELARGPEPSGEASVEDLIKQLGRVDRGEVRREAAKKLGRLSPAATPAISALLKSAVDVNANVREAALHALNAIDPAWPKNPEAKKANPDLVAALKSWAPDVSRAAFKLLDSIGLPAVPDMVNALSIGEDTIDKVYIMRLLGRIGPQAASAVPELTRGLGSKTLQVRVVAAEALANMGPAVEAAVPALIAGLADPFADGRRAMALCLGGAGAAAEPAIPALLPLLADRDSRVREAAAVALEQIGPMTIPALIEIIQTRDMRRLKAWINSMKEFSGWFTRPRTDVVVIDYEKAWNNINWAAYDQMEEHACLEAAQEAALKVLGKFGPASSSAVPTISQALADRNPGIKLAAVQALGQIGTEASSAIPALIPILVDHNLSLRKAAATVLQNIDPHWADYPTAAEAYAGIARQLSEEEEEEKVGELAVEAFEIIGAAAVPILIEALECGDRVTRQNAAKALGLIGPEAKAAIPALTKLLKDDHPLVKDEAAKALAKITGV